MLLTTCLDYDEIYKSHEVGYLPVDAPEKTWPKGWGKKRPDQA